MDWHHLARCLLLWYTKFYLNIERKTIWIHAHQICFGACLSTLACGLLLLNGCSVLLPCVFMLLVSIADLSAWLLIILAQLGSFLSSLSFQHQSKSCVSVQPRSTLPSMSLILKLRVCAGLLCTW